MEEPQIEPELLTSPPRRTKRRGTRGFGTLFSQYFLLPVFAMTACMMLWGIHSVIVRVAGPVINSQIVDRYRKRDHDDHKWRYYLSYRAVINGKPQTFTESFDEASYQKTPIGSTVPLEISPIFPGYDSALLIPGSNIWGIAWGTGFASVILLGGNGALFWIIYLIPIRRRKLVSSGIPVVGRLIDKSSSGGPPNKSSTTMPIYYLYYEYEPVEAESPLGNNTKLVTLSGRQIVRDSDWNKAQIGDAYTILYDPKNPKFSVLYLYGDFEVVKND